MNQKILKTLSEMKFSILGVALILVLVGAIALVGSRYVSAADDPGNGTSLVPAVLTPAKKLEGKLLYAKLKLNGGLVKLQKATTKLQADYNAIIADESLDAKTQKDQLLSVVSKNASQNVQTYCRYFILFPNDITSDYKKKSGKKKSFSCGTLVSDLMTSYKKDYMDADADAAKADADDAKTALDDAKAAAAAAHDAADADADDVDLAKAAARADADVTIRDALATAADKQAVESKNRTVEEALGIAKTNSKSSTGVYSELLTEMTNFKKFIDGVDMQKYIDAKFPSK